VPLTFLLGGARSGKSRLAVRMATGWAGPVVFLATAEARDADMAERVERHRRERPVEWETLEAPLDLADALARAPGEAFVIVDCLTLWVSNLLEAGRSADTVEQAAREAAARAAGREAPTVVVSNEVGLGIVPETALGRAFRDVLGLVNAAFADAAEPTYLVVAGRVLALDRAPT
jgi:adenosyl cobinamide kinase/adenosyl cobinamide phosphate guanylyltransferase